MAATCPVSASRKPAAGEPSANGAESVLVEVLVEVEVEVEVVVLVVDEVEVLLLLLLEVLVEVLEVVPGNRRRP